MDLIPLAFKTTLDARNHRPGTITLYLRAAGLLLGYFGTSAEHIEKHDVLEWIGYAQSELAWKPRTINVALAAFRVLFESVGCLPVMDGVRKLRVDHPEPVVLSTSEVGGMLAAASTVTVRAAIMLLYGSGLRVSELLALRFADIDSARGVVVLEHTKNRHARHALLPVRAVPLLREIWRWRRAHGGVAREDLIFVSRAGRALGRDVVARALVACAERAGVHKRVYPHLLRHSFATHMIERGTDVTTVQKLLGHRSLSSTARYVHLTAATRAGLKSPVDVLPMVRPPAA